MSNLSIPDDFKTRREQDEAAVRADLSAYAQDIISDPLFLCEVVVKGQLTWMRECFTRYRGLPVPVQECEGFYLRFCREVQRQFNCGEGDPKKVAGMVLDQAEAKTPLTQLEEDRSWRIETGGSEAGRRALYGDRDPNAILDEVMDRGRTVAPIVVRTPDGE